MATPGDVEEAICAVTGRLQGVLWYGFGSFFKGATTYSDIDILAVCPDIATGAKVRAVLADLCVDWPIHLTVMDRSEADATNFVQTEDCVELAKPGNPTGGGGVVRAQDSEEAEQ